MGTLHVTSVRQLKKALIAVVGGLVLFLGFALIFLLGPAFIVILAGLAILATELEWAQRWLHKCREKLRQAKAAIKSH